jgi:hypothetical protein
MHFNNLRDIKSGQTFYEAMQALIDLRYAGVPITSVGPIPFFENVLPGIAGNFSVLGVTRALTATQSAYRRIALPSVGGQNVTDYTFLQSGARWDDKPFSIFNNTFVNPQYAALNTWSTFAISNYNSAQVSVRQRLSNDITFDFNYTLSHSLDDASGLQNAGNFSTASLIFNPLDPLTNYADSDFDIRHNINANWLVGLPFGRNKKFLNDSGKLVNGILGGWDITGIFRWNSGLPTATTRPFAFQRWDLGLHKTFRMPWEGHALTFRAEVFNLTNTQRLTGFNGSGISTVDPFIAGGPAPLGFGNFTSTQAPLGETKAGRLMQFALRYVF